MESFKEDSDVFEITDFTTASDWERFIASLEEIFNDWKMGSSDDISPLEKDDMTTGVWKQEKDQITFADFKFTVTRHYLVRKRGEDEKVEDTPEGVNKEESTSEELPADDDESPLPVAFGDIMNAANDFPGKAHCLVRWFGIRDFIILNCATSGESVSSESRVKILISSINVAINNTGCSVPVFLEVDRPQRQLYVGVCEGAGMRIDFEMASLKRISHHFHYMAGLLDMFHKKLNCSLTALPKITVAVRFTYVLNNWPLHLTPCVPDSEDDEIEYNQFQAGPLEDPISDLVVSTTWPRVDSIMVADSDVYSDLDPMSAPQWHLRAAFHDQPRCNLWETIRQFMKLCKRRETMNELFRPRGDENIAGSGQVTYQPNLSKAFERLTEARVHMPNITSAVLQATSQFRGRKMENAPLPDFFIEELMDYIFTEQVEASERPQDLDLESVKDESESGRLSPSATLDDRELVKGIEKQLKCAPLSSITHRLAICLACLNRHSGGIYAVAQLWQEVFMELRTRWEAGMFIPDLGGGANGDSPDLGTSLFHQKLQMINCCIARKVARETAPNPECVETEWKEAQEEIQSEAEDEDEEEFFDCNQEPPSAQASPRGTTDCRPVGRKERCGQLSLLLQSEEPLCVPYTQEAAPVTEDMVEEQTNQLACLGTSEEGASQRARMQCASLVSDMEAFKAANPKSCLADFVRWYSPRDFVADPSGTSGSLSNRMQVPGNLWAEAWEGAKAVPARLQRRLFDDTAEAERVFRFLGELRPADLCLALLPNILAEAVAELRRYDCRCPVRPPDMGAVLEALLERAGLATRQAVVGVGVGGLGCYEEVFRRVAHAEMLLARARSLEAKFLHNADAQPEARAAVTAVLDRCLSETPDVPLVGAARGPVGQALQRLMVECQVEERQASDGTDGGSARDPSGADEGRGLGQAKPRFPEPAGKEYILRSEVPVPSQYARPGPHRMYCAVRPEDFRLCGAFSRDTMFF